MYVDFKVTVWERVWIPEDMEPEVQERIEKGEITNANEIYDLKQEYDIVEDPSTEYIVETEQYLTPEQNYGHATIEILDADEEVIFRNGKSYFEENLTKNKQAPGNPQSL
jgi:hypothetical protein